MFPKRKKTKRNPARTGGAIRQAWPACKKPLGFVALALAIGVIFVAALALLEHRVLTGTAQEAPSQVRVRLVSSPSWMPTALARRIAGSLLSPEANYYDKKLTAEIQRRAERNPWVRSVVRVEKYLSPQDRCGVVDVAVEFRMPVAKIATPIGYAYIDAEAVRLPAEQVPQWAGTAQPQADGPAVTTYYLRPDDAPPAAALCRVHYILIDGVASPPPPVGQRWEGQDLADGLRLVEILSTRSYAHQITAVDVRNYEGRITSSSAEPHLRIYAQAGRSRRTDIRFGRFPYSGGDHVVSPRRKISYLDQYVEDHDGRLAGVNSYIDLRYDELHFSIN